MMMDLFIEAVVMSFAVGGVLGAIFAFNIRKPQTKTASAQSFSREI